MTDTDTGTGRVSIQRASFLLRCNTLGGSYITLAGVYSVLEASSSTSLVTAVVAVLAGVLLLANAVRIYRNPDSIEQATEQTPRRWFVGAGIIGLFLVLSLIVVIITG